MAPLERPADLTGWKEIAAYLGRSTRSVQRWENELGLPVRRVRIQTSEVVFARRDEIDAWLEARSARGRRVWIVAGSLLGVAVLALVAGRALRARGAVEPARWTVEDGLLVVRDIQGGFLWAHRFDRPLDTAVVRAAHPWLQFNGLSAVTFSDLEGDSTTEVLAAVLQDVYCFEHDGRLRFRHSVRRSVRFGDDVYGPEFTARAPVVVPRVGGASIWVASVNAFFPAVVQKLDVRGRALGEYWMAGHPMVLRELEVGGRRVLAVGGIANETNRATLSILDPERPTATAPATVDQYRCRDCPDGQPLAFLAFPRTDLSGAGPVRPYVMDIVPAIDGLRVLLVSPSSSVVGRGSCGGDIHYTVDTGFRPVRAEFGDAYELCHAELRAKGILDHDLGPRDEAALFPVEAWYGGAAMRIDGPAPPGRMPTGDLRASPGRSAN